jgi:hypothetical protein
MFDLLETVLGFTSPMEVMMRGRTRFSTFNTPPTCEAVKLDLESVNSLLAIIYLYIDNEAILEESVVLLQLKKGGVAKAKGEGEKEKECTTECKSPRRRDEKAPWALNDESGEGGGDAKGRRRGGEKRAMYV